MFIENQSKLTSNPERASDSLSLKTSSALSSSDYVKFYRQKYFVGSGEWENVKERCKKNYLKRPKSFSQLNIVVPKNDSGHLQVINLKNLNQCTPYTRFKMERSFSLK